MRLAGGGLALRAGLDLGDETDVVELQGRRRVLDRARLFVAPMTTLFDHGLSREIDDPAGHSIRPSPGPADIYGRVSLPTRIVRAPSG